MSHQGGTMKIFGTKKHLASPTLLVLSALVICCSDNSSNSSNTPEDSPENASGWYGETVETVDDLEAGCPKYVGLIGDSVFVTKENKVYRCYGDGWAVKRELGCAPIDIKECPKYDPNKEFCDPRDHQVYKFVKINGKTWMAENLNFDYTIDGESYGNACSDGLSVQYGRYYSWAAALDSAGIFSDHSKGCGRQTSCQQEQPVRGICPEGWHIPSLADVDYLPLNDSEGDLRSTTGWDWLHIRYSKNYGADVNGKDTYGFSAFPSGSMNVDEKIEDEGGRAAESPDAFFWIATSQGQYYLSISTNEVAIYSNANDSFGEGLSIRCIKDEEITPCEKAKYNPDNQFCDTRDGQIYSYKKIGNQTWMTQNLRYAKGGFCFHDYDGNGDSVSQFNCDKYGRFYYSLEQAKAACPKGWHLPKLSEIEELVDTVTGKIMNNEGCSGSYTDEEGYYHDACYQRDSLAWINLIAPVEEWCYSNDYINPFDGLDDCYSPIDIDNISSYNHYGFSLLPAGSGGKRMGSKACLYLSVEEHEYNGYIFSDVDDFCCSAYYHYDEDLGGTIYSFQCSPGSDIEREVSVRCIKD